MEDLAQRVAELEAMMRQMIAEQDRERKSSR
jgi:hypothetical protein